MTRAGRTARTGRGAAAVAALAVSVLLLGGCTGGGDDDADGRGDGRTSDDDVPTLTSEEVSEQLLDTGDALAEREPLATVEAEVPLTPAPAVLTLDVLEVLASPTGTVVSLQVTAPQPVSAQVSTFSLEEFANPEYVSDIDLLDPRTQERLFPFQAAEGGRWCQCSAVPNTLGPVPSELSATFPALDEATTTVDVRLGRFPVAEDVPVTR